MHDSSMSAVDLARNRNRNRTIDVSMVTYLAQFCSAKKPPKKVKALN